MLRGRQAMIDNWKVFVSTPQGLLWWLALMALLVVAGVSETSGAPEQTTNTRGLSIRLQCIALERQGRYAQTRLAQGYIPSEKQRATAEAKIAWYIKNCT